VDEYEKALKRIQYTNTVNSVSKADRTVTIAIEDGLNPAVSASYALAVAADDDAIEIKNADTSLLSVTESPADSSANPISQFIFADSGGALTFVDPDTAGSGSVAISGIQVSISGGFEDGVDTLTSSASSNINFSWSGNTLALSPVSGSATLTEYVNALKTIKFENDSDTPDTSTRQISLKINDQPLSDFRKISVDDINDPPGITTASLPTQTYVATTGSPISWTVSELLTQAGATDRDLTLPLTQLGIGVSEVIDAGTSGTWKYNKNGAGFVAFPAGISNTNVIQLDNDDVIQFDGEATVGSAHSLSFKAWDMTEASVDSTSSSAYSSTSATKNMTILTPATTVTVEAESITTRSDYSVISNTAASNGQMLQATATSGSAQFTFSGVSAKYDIVVQYFDENDGITTATLKSDNVVLGTSWRWDNITGNSNSPNANSLKTHTIPGQNLTNGATILFEYSDVIVADEPARLDKFTFNPVA
jgi:hypothetical protein